MMLFLSEFIREYPSLSENIREYPSLSKNIQLRRKGNEQVRLYCALNTE